MKLCGYEMKKGQTKIVSLPVMKHTVLRAICICGSERKDAPTLVVTAGVHGCEYVGIEAAFRLAEHLSQRNLRGNVIILPIVNQSGFVGGYKRIVPEDGVNLNRAFPSNVSINTGLSAHIAKAIERYIYPEADFLLDLHCGDWNESLIPFVFYPAAGEDEVNERSKRAARSLTVPYCVRSFSKNGLYSYAVQKGIPALLLERGCAGRWSEQEAEETVGDVLRLLTFLCIYENEGACTKTKKSMQYTEETQNKEEKERQVKQGEQKEVNMEHIQIDIETAQYEESDADGFWYPRVSAGEAITQGQLLGIFVPMENRWNLEGPEAKRCKIFAQFTGVVLYLTEALGVCEGEALIAYGKTQLVNGEGGMPARIHKKNDR